MAAQACLCLAWSETPEDTFCHVVAHTNYEHCISNVLWVINSNARVNLTLTRVNATLNIDKSKDTWINVLKAFTKEDSLHWVSISKSWFCSWSAETENHKQQLILYDAVTIVYKLTYWDWQPVYTECCHFLSCPSPPYSEKEIGVFI